MTVLIKIDRYLRTTGLSVTTFGRLATNDPRLVGDLKHGRQPREATVRRIEAFMTRHPEPIPSLNTPRRKGRAR